MNPPFADGGAGMKSPAFQWYPGDYLASQRVQLMTLEEEGAYNRLLNFCWIHGSIPSEPELLAKLIGKGASTTLATKVATMFQPAASNRLIHDRLEAERRKQAVWREKSAQGGKKSAAKRSKLRSQKHYNEGADKGSLQNGTNQTSTLPSSVSCLPSTNIPIQELQLEDGSEKPEASKTDLQRRAERLFHRRETTVWDGQEMRAWRAARSAVSATNEEDWKLLEWFYERPANEDTYRRRDLATLLNNWGAEIDRARNYKSRGPNAKHRTSSSRGFENQQDYSGVTDK